MDAIDQEGVLKGDLPDSIAETVFSLSVNAISEPVEGPFGWMLIKVNDITPAVIKPLNEVKEQIKTTLASDLALDKLYETVDMIDSKTSEGQTLLEIGQSINIPVETATGLTPDGQLINGVTLSQPSGVLATLITEQPFLSTVTELNEGEISLSTELTGNRFFVAQASKIKEPTIPELSDIKDKVTEDYNNTRKQQELDKRSATMVQNLNDGQSLGDTTNTMTTIKGLTRVTNLDDSQINYAMLNTIFETDVKSAFTTTADGKTYVLFVESMTPAPPANEQETKENNTLISQTLSNDLLESYDSLLREKYKIIINQPTINQIYIP